MRVMFVVQQCSACSGPELDSQHHKIKRRRERRKGRDGERWKKGRRKSDYTHSKTYPCFEC